MMNLIANIVMTVSALFCMVVFLGGDITKHREMGHSNAKYSQWLRKSGELLSPKRLLLLVVFLGNLTTMAQESWIVIMILAAALLILGIAQLKGRQWKLMERDKRTDRMLSIVLWLVMLVGIFTIRGAYVHTNALFASHIMTMWALMFLLVTPFLTMLAAWMLKLGRGVNGPEQHTPQD